jgi:hypothetical protein
MSNVNYVTVNNIQEKKMFTDNQADALKPLKELLQAMSDKAGALFLIELIAHPNQPIHVSQLRYLHSLPLLDRPEYRPYEGNNAHKSSFRRKQESSPLFSHALANPFDETSIRFCDQKTIDQVKKRLSKLQSIKAEAQNWNDYARLEELYREEEFLIEYLKKAFNKNGNPRFLRNRGKDDYSYVKKSIERVIAKIRKLDPALADEIDKHLKTGLRFEWQ